jgi:hypothetical protein
MLDARVVLAAFTHLANTVKLSPYSSEHRLVTAMLQLENILVTGILGDRKFRL